MISEFPSSDAVVVSEEDICTLIRLALACEVSKRPLKREDIISLVLGGNSRNFRSLLSEANTRLARDFAMQIVALPTTTRSISTSTVAGRKAATAAKRDISTINSTLYILLSTKSRPSFLPCHRNPDRLGLLAIILSLIALSGNELEEEVLLDKLSLLTISTETFGVSLGDLMTEWKRQKYLSTSKKSDDMNVLFYSAGPRAALEFPLDQLAKFIVDLQPPESADELLSARVNTTLRQRQKN